MDKISTATKPVQFPLKPDGFKDFEVRGEFKSVVVSEGEMEETAQMAMFLLDNIKDSKGEEKVALCVALLLYIKSEWKKEWKKKKSS